LLLFHGLKESVEALQETSWLAFAIGVHKTAKSSDTSEQKDDLVTSIKTFLINAIGSSRSTRFRWKNAVFLLSVANTGYRKIFTNVLVYSEAAYLPLSAVSQFFRRQITTSAFQEQQR